MRPDLFIVFVRYAIGDRAFIAAAPKLWNTLPKTIRNIDNFNLFKNKLKTFLFRQAFNDFKCLDFTIFILVLTPLVFFGSTTILYFIDIYIFYYCTYFVIYLLLSAFEN